MTVFLVDVSREDWLVRGREEIFGYLFGRNTIPSS